MVEINKDVLLDLLELVSQAISETEFALDPEYAHEQSHKPDNKVWSKLKAQTNLALNCLWFINEQRTDQAY